jgi:hypothetical protein
MRAEPKGSEGVALSRALRRDLRGNERPPCPHRLAINAVALKLPQLRAADAQPWADNEMEPVPSTVMKTYPQRGPLQQFRFAESFAFSCFRCGETKKSKLITIYSRDWSKRLCNDCYGRLLSLYEIKAGTAADDQRADELATVLLSLVTQDDQRQAERLFRTSERCAERLCSEAVRFVATSEHVAGHLQDEPHLEWSPAVIGLCKAVEAEVVSRILRPLADRASHTDLTKQRQN